MDYPLIFPVFLQVGQVVHLLTEISQGDGSLQSFSRFIVRTVEFSLVIDFFSLQQHNVYICESLGRTIKVDILS